jgi:hypothetical protein
MFIEKYVLVYRHVKKNLKFWNNKNMVKRTPFWSTQKPERSSWSPLYAYKVFIEIIFL